MVARRSRRRPAPVLPAGRTKAFLAEVSGWIDAELEPEPARSAPPDPRRDRGERPTVLIAEDNADLRRHLERICAEHWIVEAVGDGRAALAAIRARRPDVLVTDVMMPGLDGLGLVAAIRADAALRNLPVIILSARAGMEEAGAGLAAGTDDYLPKPFRTADLVNRISARLHAADRERDRHQREQAETRRAALLGELAAAVSAAASTRDILAALLASPAAFGATVAGLGVLDPQRSRLRLTDTGGAAAGIGLLPSEDPGPDDTIDLNGADPLARVARTGESLVVEDTESDPRFAASVEDVVEGALDDAGPPAARAAILHPVRDTRGSVAGVVALTWPHPRTFSQEERDLALAAAGVIGRALERTNVAEREHLIATGLQEHHLDLDRRTGAAVLAARYQPAAELMHVGGDWYLSAPSGDHRVAVSVGDAVGHGLASATVMSRLRAAATAATLTDPAPRQVLHQLDRYAGSMPDATCTTVSYALLDARTGALDYACAGHPYPLLVTEDGLTRYLTDGRRPPLGIRSRAGNPGHPGHDRLPPGTMLVLYTDGLIERRGEGLTIGFQRLAGAAVAAARLPAEQACAHLLAALAPPEGYNDDVAILALRPAGSTATSLVAAHPADPEALSYLRERVRTWLDPQHLDAETVQDIVLCVEEAVSGAVERGANAKPKNHIGLEMFADPGLIRTTVSDPGHWTGDPGHWTGDTDPSQDARNGLAVIRALSDHTRVDRGPRGTLVTTHHRRIRAADRQAAAAT